MAEIEWKGAKWKAAYGNLSVKELLTILKGFGPMEILEFEKSGYFRGQLSLSLSEEGTKEITLYHLEVLAPHREGHGRVALQWLRKIFKGGLYVEDPGVVRIKNGNVGSLPFWLRMCHEGLVDAINGENCPLLPCAREGEAENMAKSAQAARQSEE